MAPSLLKPLPPLATAADLGSNLNNSGVIKQKSSNGSSNNSSENNNKPRSIKGWFQQRRFYYRRLGNYRKSKCSNSNGKKGNKNSKVLPGVKVRVEPKTFFANERTFISWLQFCALILTISLSLINFGDHVSQLCGGFFLIIAALLSIYALWRYQYRAFQIRTRSNTRYDDLYGPAILCFLLVIAIIVNFSLRFNQPPATGALSPYRAPGAADNNSNSP